RYGYWLAHFERSNRSAQRQDPNCSRRVGPAPPGGGAPKKPRHPRARSGPPPPSKLVGRLFGASPPLVVTPLRTPLVLYAGRRQAEGPTGRHRSPEPSALSASRWPRPRPSIVSPRPAVGRFVRIILSRRVHLMSLSWLQRLLKKPRPLSRSARRHTLMLEALEDRTVPTFLPPVTFPVGVAPHAVTVADFNHDGKPDLAVVNTGSFSTSSSQGS